MNDSTTQTTAIQSELEDRIIHLTRGIERLNARIALLERDIRELTATKTGEK